MKRLHFALFCTLLSFPIPAGATFSVVATDQETGYVAGALASCTSFLNNPHPDGLILHTAPGVGVVHSQSIPNPVGAGLMTLLLGLGYAPSEIVEMFDYSNRADANPEDPRYLPEAVDFLYESRQYGLADVYGGAAAHTGSSDDPILATPRERGDRQGAMDRFVYSIQGNTLTDLKVLDNMERGFARGVRCNDVLDRVVQSLYFGQRGRHGDFRCVDGGRLNARKGLSSNQAYAIVQDADGNELVRFEYTCSDYTGRCKDGAREIRRQWIQFKRKNGCLN